MKRQKKRKGQGRRYFIDLYLENYIPTHYELKFVPTYACNLACPYCYTRPFRRNYPGEMAWDTFTQLLDRFVAEGGRQVRILGGEPTTWSHIDRAVALMRQRGLRTIMLSNGTIAVHELPDELHLNIEHYYEGHLKETVLAVLDSYQRRGALVRFRYNIQDTDPADKIDEILDLAKATGAVSLHLGTAWPHEHTLRFGRQIVDTVRKIRRKGLGCTLGDPMPFCLFTAKQIDELCEIANFSGRCMCGHIPMINPDGGAVFPCQALGVARPFHELGALRNVRRAFCHEVGTFVRAVEPRCRRCRHFLAGDCQDGCLGNRIRLLERSVEGGSLDRIIVRDRFEAAPGTVLPASTRGRGGWHRWRQGRREIRCQVDRALQEYHRGDWIIARIAGQARLALLVGLPGETLALTPTGELIVQDLDDPAGAYLTCPTAGRQVLCHVVDGVTIWDLDWFQMLVIPATSITQERLQVTGTPKPLPIGALAGKAVRLGRSLGPIGACRGWDRTSIGADASVLECELLVEAGDDTPHGNLSARFALDAPQGALVAVDLLETRSHKVRARAHCLHERDGQIGHMVRLEPVARRIPGGPCKLFFHLGGRRIGTFDETLG